MYTLLLVLIYIAFISLGLPDSLLGSGWPVMHSSLQVPVSYMGIVTMIIAGGTVASSLCSYRLTKKLGTSVVTNKIHPKWLELGTKLQSIIDRKV